MRQIIGFHNPDESYGYLSNWYLSEFTIKNITFYSMEQYMMYQKAMLFQDIITAEQILQTSNQGHIKMLGHSVKNYDDIIWNGMRQLIVYEGLVAKFQQNEDLHQKLLHTNDAILAECAVQDRIWGIGLSMTDENRFNISKWRGQNLLGFALMQVRNSL